MNSGIPIKFQSGGFLLDGDLRAPPGSKKGVVMSHGLESDMEGDKWPVIAEILNNLHIGSVRFNHRGCGNWGRPENGSVFAESTLTDRIEDLEQATLQLNPPIAALGGIGSSFGGMVVLGASKLEFKAIVLMATPKILPADLIGDTADELITLPSGQTLNRSFFEDTGRYDMTRLISRLRIPVLIIHGSADEVVPVSDAHDLYQVANYPKKLLIVEGADHTFTDPEAKVIVINAAVDWMEQYLRT